MQAPYSIPIGEIAVLLLFFALPPILLASLGAVLRSKQLKTHAPTLRIVLGNLMLLAVLGSSVVLAGEVYMRFIRDTTDAAALTLTNQRWNRRHLHLNEAGYRDSIEYDWSRRSARRVTFLGDSFTAGQGVSDVEDRFANRVRAMLPDSEVHIIAKPGWDTGTQAATIRTLAAEGYDLDLVVLVYCLNDLSDIMPEWGAMIRRRNVEFQEPRFFADYSYLFNWISIQLLVTHDPELGSYLQQTLESYTNATWERQRRRLLNLRDKVVAGGGDLVVVTFPYMREDRETVAAAHERLDELWSSVGIPYLDLRAAFAEIEPQELTVNRWDDHPNERANAIAASEIAGLLESQGLRVER